MTNYDKTRQADRQEGDQTGNPRTLSLFIASGHSSLVRLPRFQLPAPSFCPPSFCLPSPRPPGFLHHFCTMKSNSPDSKWTGPFSTRFCCRGVTSKTCFPKAGYANTGNSKWTKRIDFWSTLAHFEISSASHSSLLSLGLAQAVPERNFTGQKLNFGKEKVKKR